MANYSEEDEKKIVAWIELYTGEKPNSQGKEAFREWLKDGLVLCKLGNSLQPGRCKPNQLHEDRVSGVEEFKEMDNIQKFLDAMVDFGVPKSDLFDIADLYKGNNLRRVQISILKLKAFAATMGY